MSEGVAHLNYLSWRGQLQRSEDSDGRYQFLSVDDTLEQRLQPGGHVQDDAPMVV